MLIDPNEVFHCLCECKQQHIVLIHLLCNIEQTLIREAKTIPYPRITHSLLQLTIERVPIHHESPFSCLLNIAVALASSFMAQSKHTFAPFLPYGRSSSITPHSSHFAGFASAGCPITFSLPIFIIMCVSLSQRSL